MAKKMQKQKNNPANIVQFVKNLPIPVLLMTIENQLGVLREKGIEVRDWENKDRVIKQVRWVGGKAYFFAEDCKTSD